MPKSSRKSVCNLFYGYPVEEIMRVCVVSRATAQHFKRGSRAPSSQTKRLWALHTQGRILGPEWDGFRVHRNELVDPDGLVYTTGEVASIPLLYAQISELRREIDKVKYTRSLGELDFSEVTNALGGLIRDGTKLLAAVEKIPRRSAIPSRKITLASTTSKTDCSDD